MAPGGRRRLGDSRRAPGARPRPLGRAAGGATRAARRRTGPRRPAGAGSCGPACAAFAGSRDGWFGGRSTSRQRCGHEPCCSPPGAVPRRRYRGAWRPMDRVNNADDNGERLFEHLRANRPDINAWFTVGSNPGLTTGGCAPRRRALVAWARSLEAAMLNAQWLVSSHVDRPGRAAGAHSGRPAAGRGSSRSRSTGSSRTTCRLAQQPRDRPVRDSTAAELAVRRRRRDGLQVTSKETRNTGLPRFDRLLAKAQAVPPSERDLVIIAPTWRTRLTGAIDPSDPAARGRRRVLDSDYHASWMGILRSDAIAERGQAPRLAPGLHAPSQPPGDADAARAAGARRAAVLRGHGRPGPVRALRPARHRLLVGGLQPAYLDRPIVYFQFDRER